MTEPRTLEVPALSLVLLIGASSSGKSTFAARHFRPTEVVSSDRMRGWVDDDEASQDASADAFAVMHQLVDVRLKRGHLTVVDATNLDPAHRATLLALARGRHALTVAIVLDVPEAELAERHRARTDRAFPVQVLRGQVAALKRGLRGVRDEGFHRTFVLRGALEIDAAAIRRVPLWTDRRDLHGPFDIVGDVHGCRSELDALLAKLGWVTTGERVHHPAGRTAVFVGDLVDRGPDSPGVLRRVAAMVRDGTALCVAGNHDVRLVKALRGQKVTRTHGLAGTLEQLATTDEAFRADMATFLDGLVSHYVLDDGKLVVAHAGCKEEYQGRGSAKVRAFCLYGDTSGELDGYGLPVRADWAADYRGRAKVVHGHVPVVRAGWVNGVIDIDTGCVFGGTLTALRWPEQELVDVPAERQWCEPVRPLAPPTEASRPPTRLDLRDVTGNRRIETRLLGGIGLSADQSAGALELASRFAVDPRWLIYLPPTMSPCDTAPADSPFLEHPAQAYAHFRLRGVDRVVLEEKHMGSRAVALVCRTPDVAVSRFGVERPTRGRVLTRTGRPFFPSPAAEDLVLQRLAEALEAAGRWAAWDTDWVALDTEVLPWSTKARTLIDEQYAPTGALAVHETGRAVTWLREAVARDPSLEPLLARATARAEAAAGFQAAWQRYVAPPGDPSVEVAPFQVLATEGAVHVERDHAWHLAELATLTGPGLRETRHRVVTLGDPAEEAAGEAFWTVLTEGGGEGVVVKPLAGVVRDGKGHLLQPAVKVRGREYLRVVYGPEYTLPENLERLRSRSLQKKRSLALREFALGHEALCRFVERRPLHEVHATVFGVLALESEPVDPRL
jgi:protein phosphatase